MENLCDSANNGGEDTYDVLNLPTIPNPSRDRTGQPVVRTDVVETSRTQTRSSDDSKSRNVKMVHDRTGQPVVGTNTRTVQDGRKTSRSQEIDTRSFHEEAVSSDRTGQPVVETSRTQTRSSDDSKSRNVKMVHDRTRQPAVETNTENAPDCCQTRSCHESIRFNVGDEALRDRTGQPVVNHDDSCHEQTMLNEADMDFRIPGLPHSVVKHAQSSRVRELVQKKWRTSRPTCSSTRSTTKQSLQPVQSGIKTNDSGRDAVQSMPIILE